MGSFTVMSSIDGKSILDLVVVGGTLILLFLFWSRRQNGRGGMALRNKSCRFPPSPPINSIMGHRLPDKHPFVKIGSWIEEYGPLISLRAGMERYVVIGRHKAAMDILEKQGAVSADRPRWIASNELLARGFRISLMSAGERFKRMRKALHTHLQPKAVQTYKSLQVSHAKQTVLSLLESPERFEDHARTFAASVILKLTYGKNTPTHASHPDVLQIRESLKRSLLSIRPGAYLVDNLPWLKYVPWYGRDLRRAFIEDVELYHRLLHSANSQNDVDSGPSFAKFLLSREMDFGLSEMEMAFLSGGLFAAGSQSTALAICIAMTAAARYPDAQAAVQVELDAVVGNGRLPTFEDEKSLPLLRAFILESTRWGPLLPLGFAHCAVENIVWGDYYIPAGTTIFGNLWAISRDPEVFPDPDKFDPKRWLTSDGDLREDLYLPYFGFGRRICPGLHVAARSLYINTALVLWAFHITLDESTLADHLTLLSGEVKEVDPIGLRFKPRIPRETLKMMLEG